MYNIILILALIGVIFFITNNEKMNEKLNKHSVKLIFALLLVYMLINKLYHGLFIIVIVFLIYYNKKIIEYVKRKGFKFDFDFNKLRNKFESFVNKNENESDGSQSDLEPSDIQSDQQSDIGQSDANENKKEKSDIFMELDKLETLANKNSNIKREPFKNMVSELRKTFDNLYKQVNS